MLDPCTVTGPEPGCSTQAWTELPQEWKHLVAEHWARTGPQPRSSVFYQLGGPGLALKCWVLQRDGENRRALSPSCRRQ